jgi:hypothetical protein
MYPNVFTPTVYTLISFQFSNGYFFIFNFLVFLGVELRALFFARKVLYLLSHAPAIFGLVCFSYKVSAFAQASLRIQSLNAA